MQTLVLGASGATGKHLVDQLLDKGHKVKLIVRTTASIPEYWKTNQSITIITASVAEMTLDQMTGHLKDCQAAASCLGHNLTWKGVFGKPRKLVRDAVRLLGEAAIHNASDQPIKIVLMNTAGNSNRDLNESISMAQRIVIGLVRLLVPPHADNEQAADYLRVNIGQNNPYIEWVVVRPDTLIDEDEVTAYDMLPSPSRSAIFNPGKTSRINVGNFMARLINEDKLWDEWRGKMPVIYNSEP